MKAVEGYHLIKPEELSWRRSNLMKIPNADYLERTGSENLGAPLWRLPAETANTLHKHIGAEEFYFVLEGVGRMRVGDDTLTVPKYGACWSRQSNCASYSTTPMPKYSGSSLVRRRKPSFYLAQRPSPTCHSFTRSTRNNYPK